MRILIILSILLFLKNISAQSIINLDTINIYDISYFSKNFTEDFLGKISTDSLVVTFNTKDSVLIRAKYQKNQKAISFQIPTQIEGIRLIYNRNSNQQIRVCGLYRHKIAGVVQNSFMLDTIIQLNKTLRASPLIVDIKLKSIRKVASVSITQSNSSVHKCIGHYYTRRRAKKVLQREITYEYNYLTEKIIRLR